jgi:SAM-dependent methyltransferase
VTEWFEQWFGEEYLRLYPHRDDADAGDAVALIDRVVPLAGRCVLDLACGPGRHATQLAVRGARVTGLDLSLPLLGLAHRRTAGAVRLVRGDMRRLPFRAGAFDVVANLFTSFGYFVDDAQHGAVLRSLVPVMRRGGTFVLDYLNAPAVRAHLVTREERVVGAQRVVVARRISADGQFVIKEMHLLDDGRSFLERVRLFTADELERLLTGAGLRVRLRFGDYAGGPPSDTAPRVILVAERP